MRVFKVIETLEFGNRRKVFYREVNVKPSEREKVKIKRLKNYSTSLFEGIYDYEKLLETGDLFILEN